MSVNGHTNVSNNDIISGTDRSFPLSTSDGCNNHTSVSANGPINMNANGRDNTNGPCNMSSEFTTGAANGHTSISNGSVDKWVRPASHIDHLLIDICNNHAYLTAYCLELVTARPLSEELIHAALLQLFRVVPTLRLSFGWRDGELWMKEVQEDFIDFKVLKNVNKVQELEMIAQTGFDVCTQPWWRARLIQNDPDQLQGHRSFPTLPKYSGNFQHYSSVMLGFNHVLTDGTSNIAICSRLIDIIDELLGGREITNFTQIGELATGEVYDALFNEHIHSLPEGEKYLKKMIEKQKKFNELNTTLSMLRPDMSEVRDEYTRIIMHTMNLTDTQKFLKKCKSEKVTVHSAITAITNAAVVELLKDVADLTGRSSIQLKHNHAVNLRRYLKGDASKVLGFHVGDIRVANYTPLDWKPNFWNNARNIYMELLQSLEDKIPITTEAIKDILKNPCDVFMTAEPFFDCESSNMGDITGKLIKKKHDNVELADVHRLYTLSKNCHFFALNAHCYAGCMHLLLTYMPRRMDKHTAEKLFSYIQETLAYVCTV